MGGIEEVRERGKLRGDDEEKENKRKRKKERERDVGQREKNW